MPFIDRDKPVKSYFWNMARMTFNFFSYWSKLFRQSLIEYRLSQQLHMSTTLQHLSQPISDSYNIKIQTTYSWWRLEDSRSTWFVRLSVKQRSFHIVKSIRRRSGIMNWQKNSYSKIIFHLTNWNILYIQKYN